MFVLPIVDLWIGRPVAYALTDKSGVLIEAPTPRELYLNIYAALQRDYTPMVTLRPAYMAAEWETFIGRIPEPVWVYENGEILTGTLIIKDDSDDVGQRWVREINTKEKLKSVMASGVHYGSGLALASVNKLEILQSSMYQVQWN